MKKTIISALALGASMTAFAGDMGPASEGGFYGQVEGGYSHLNTKDINSITANNGDFGFAARAGYLFPLASTWKAGIEAGYFNLGKSTYKQGGVNVVDIKQQGFDILAVVQKQLNANFDVFGKAGAAYVDQKGKVPVAIANLKGWNTSYDKTKFLPEIAGGVAYNINDNLAVTGTVNHIFGDKIEANSSTTSVASSTSALVGLRYTFG